MIQSIAIKFNSIVEKNLYKINTRNGQAHVEVVRNDVDHVEVARNDVEVVRNDVEEAHEVAEYDMLLLH